MSKRSLGTNSDSISAVYLNGSSIELVLYL